MAVHAEPMVAATFPHGAIVDVEYERVGNTRAAKRRAGAKVSPDLIFHEREDPTVNYLVAEVKCRGHKRARAWRLGPELSDLRKIGFFTHCLENEAPTGMKSYEWGVCLELDSDGADQWWVQRPPAYGPVWVPGGAWDRPTQHATHHRRWHRPA